MTMRGRKPEPGYSLLNDMIEGLRGAVIVDGRWWADAEAITEGLARRGILQAEDGTPVCGICGRLAFNTVEDCGECDRDKHKVYYDRLDEEQPKLEVIRAERPDRVHNQ